KRRTKNTLILLMTGGLVRSPDGLHVRVVANLLVLRYENACLASSGSDNDLIRGIAMKRLRQPATLRKDRAAEFDDVKVFEVCRKIEPCIQLAVKEKLPLFDFLR